MKKARAFTHAILQKHRSNLRPLAFVVAFAVVGIAALIFSQAATPTASIEPEAGTLTGGATTVTSAAASGGQYVKFGPTGTGACTAGQLGTYPDCVAPPAITPAAGKGWFLPFQEEFSVGTSKWAPCLDWGSASDCYSPNGGREKYLTSQVQVNGGTAKLIAAPLSPPVSASNCFNGSCTYKSGILTTARVNQTNPYKFSFTYGYVDIRAKIPGVQGFFTALWLLPNNPSYSYRSEIDMIEVLGDDPKTIYMTYHYPPDRSDSDSSNNGKLNNGSCPVKDYSTDFHNYAIDWQADHIAWYIDGIKCGQSTGNTSKIENGPMHLIMQVMVGNNWQRSWNVDIQDTTLTRQLEIDYVRIFQQQ